jgi:hypothetical protein
MGGQRRMATRDAPRRDLALAPRGRAARIRALGLARSRPGAESLPVPAVQRSRQRAFEERVREAGRPVDEIAARRLERLTRRAVRGNGIVVGGVAGPARRIVKLDPPLPPAVGQRSSADARDERRAVGCGQPIVECQNRFRHATSPRLASRARSAGDAARDHSMRRAVQRVGHGDRQAL